MHHADLGHPETGPNFSLGRPDQKLGTQFQNSTNIPQTQIDTHPMLALMTVQGCK
jgi:hypothetical protein